MYQNHRLYIRNQRITKNVIEKLIKLVYKNHQHPTKSTFYCNKLNKSNMYRSASWNRGTEDYSSAPPKGLWMGSMIGSLDDDELPSYNNPPEEMIKKEKSRAKFAENAIHIIPFVLLACALVLWLFSNPGIYIRTFRSKTYVNPIRTWPLYSYT